MTVASRAFRNLARKKVRTIGVSAIVGLSLAIFLALSELNASVASLSSDLQSEDNQILSQIANVLTVQPAAPKHGGAGFDGVSDQGGGFGGAAEGLSAANITTVEDTPHVTLVQESFEAITFAGGGFGPAEPSQGTSSFGIVEGLELNGPILVITAGAPTISSGRSLTSSDANSTNAMVGSAYASSNDVSVGGTVSLNGTSFSVVGIFSTGIPLANQVIIAPYAPAAKAYNISEPSVLFVTADSANNVQALTTTLGNELGPGCSVTALAQEEDTLLSYDVGEVNSISSSILSTTALAYWAALGIGAAVIVLVMIMTMAERTREVGLLKALGFRKSRIMSQLLLETFLLSAIGYLVGIVVAIWMGPYLDKYVVSTTGTSGGTGISGEVNSLLGISSYFNGLSFQLTPEVLLIGALVTLGIGALGSIYPLLRAIQLRPSEALRHE